MIHTHTSNSHVDVKRTEGGPRVWNSVLAVPCAHASLLGRRERDKKVWKRKKERENE